MKKCFIGFFVIVSLLGSLEGKDKNRNSGTQRPPKNVIIMIGDGMGFNHVEASGYYLYGEKGKQVFENFPVKFAASTYPAKIGEYPSKLKWAHGYDPAEYWKSFNYSKDNATESAAAATELSTGKKTYNNSIGMDLDYKPLVNLSELAKSIGKSAGVATTVPFSHATPAAFAAHNVTRNNYPEIAKEMLLDSRLDVIIGCGHPFYDEKGMPLSSAKTYKYVGDSLIWNGLKEGRIKFNLGKEIKTLKDADGDGKPDKWTLIENRSDFQKYMHAPAPRRLLGVAKNINTLQESRDGDLNADPFVVPLNSNVPSLDEISLTALNVLNNNPKGSFLMIEGGAIDFANHGNQPGRMLEEMADFNKGVQAVVSWIEKYCSWDETLLIVTADHESGYLWGPEAGMPDKFSPIVNNGKGKLPGMAFYSKGHSNSLVPVFAKGRGSELLELFADETDPVRGKFINNTEIPQTVFLLWKLKK